MQELKLPCSYGTTLCVRGSNLVLVKKNSQESLPFSSIQSFRVQKPNITGYGGVEIKTAQANSFGINLGFGIAAALGSTYGFQFKKDYYGVALSIQTAIENFRNNSAPADTSTNDDSRALSESDAAQSSVSSVADELRALKSLMDDGIITEEEFAEKKRQLLGI